MCMNQDLHNWSVTAKIRLPDLNYPHVGHPFHEVACPFNNQEITYIIELFFRLLFGKLLIVFTFKFDHQN